MSILKGRLSFSCPDQIYFYCFIWSWTSFRTSAPLQLEWILKVPPISCAGFGLVLDSDVDKTHITREQTRKTSGAPENCLKNEAKWWESTFGARRKRRTEGPWNGAWDHFAWCSRTSCARTPLTSWYWGLQLWWQPSPDGGIGTRCKIQ